LQIADCRLPIVDFKLLHGSVNRQLPIGNRQFNWGDAVISIFIGALAYVTPVLLQAQPSILKRFEPTLINFLMLSFLLFVVGVAGVLSRRNIIIIFMSIELILNAVNLNLIAFSRYLEINRDALAAKGLAVNPLSGPVFTVFIIVVAAAEAAVGLGIVIAMFRNRETVAIDEIDLLKW
jgi:NADH-quinone oxidoreductase subunit K